ncbi:YjbH domain-containing protein [Salinimicrobium tongyeongense]|uniref:YjbH domain-containing protein n=1 Tax=Salinimicrobium tongyeongense TaxID=2809707 RepID=A0ABY6NP01_9FLAO|nr:YjbH domain-containing protein [Salinimicrobium tongyeongense]UZH54634.1 YjbH domain-containing protein [Salinimicrobium tongyeongense]
MKTNWISFLLYLLIISGGQAQTIQEKLYAAGFENIQVQKKKDSLNIFFEHREFRSPYHSMHYAGLLLGQENLKNISWIPVYHNTPVGKYRAGTYEYSGLTQDDRQFYRHHNNFQEDYRFHFRVHPELSARFGYYSDPFQIKLNLILDSRIYLAPGLSLQSGIAIPVQNNLDAQDTRLRLAPSMLHYFLQPVNFHFFGLSLGTFYYDRYGFDLQYRYNNLNSAWSFGLETGLTGFYWMTSGSIYSEDANNLHAIADVEYRLPIENLSLKLSAGQFLFEDLGGRLDLIRQFGTVDLGLHVSATDAGVTGGFQFAFSFWPGTLLRSKKLELRTTEEFRWEYSYNNEEPVARRYRLGIPRLDDVLRQYKSDFIQNMK